MRGVLTRNDPSLTSDGWSIAIGPGAYSSTCRPWPSRPSGRGAVGELAHDAGSRRLDGEGEDFRVYADPAGHPFCLVW